MKFNYRLVRRFGVLGCLLGAPFALMRIEDPVRATAADEPKTPAVDFNRQVRPILSENCFACHGPDRTTRKAKFRLDTKEGAFGELREGGYAIVPGKPGESELIDRITAKERTEVMPPPHSNKKLTPEQ